MYEAVWHVCLSVRVRGTTTSDTLIHLNPGQKAIADKSEHPDRALLNRTPEKKNTRLECYMVGSQPAAERSQHQS